MSDTTNSEFYPSARPGAAPQPGPTPTSRNYHPTDSHPPPPQAGAIPIPPTVTTKPTIPPPPKAGEALRSPGYHLLAASQQGPSPTFQPHYPPQMNLASPDNTARYNGQAPGSLTATPFSPPHTVSLSSHPPGYTQNPQIASDTSSFQSQNPFSPQQQQQQQQQEQRNNYQLGEYSHQPPYNYQQSRNDSGFEEQNSSYWETAKKWAFNMGEYVNGINEKASRNFK